MIYSRKHVLSCSLSWLVQKQKFEEYSIKKAEDIPDCYEMLPRWITIININNSVSIIKSTVFTKKKIIIMK